jgi:hypothetical protein
VAVVDRILVAGLPRSGTTLVGSLLSLGPRHRELWEPYNSAYRRGVEEYWPYVGPSSPAEKRERYRRLTEETLALRGVRGTRMGHRSRNPTRKRVGAVVRTSRHDLRYRSLCLQDRLSPRPGRIVKDPVASLLAGYLADEHGFAVVACMRHPAAQFLSIRKRGWRPDGFEGVLAQADAVADLFEPGELAAFEASTDVAFRFGLRYRVVYRYLRRVVAGSAAAGSTVVVHEDLVTDPDGEARRLAAGLGLDADPMAARAVELTSGSEQEHGSVYLSKVQARDARRAAEAWRQELEPDVVESILRGAGDMGPPLR